MKYQLLNQHLQPRPLQDPVASCTTPRAPQAKVEFLISDPPESPVLLVAPPLIHPGQRRDAP